MQLDFFSEEKIDVKKYKYIIPSSMVSITGVYYIFSSEHSSIENNRKLTLNLQFTIYFMKNNIFK